MLLFAYPHFVIMSTLLMIIYNKISLWTFSHTILLQYWYLVKNIVRFQPCPTNNVDLKFYQRYWTSHLTFGKIGYLPKCWIPLSIVGHVKAESLCYLRFHLLKRFHFAARQELKKIYFYLEHPALKIRLWFVEGEKSDWSNPEAIEANIILCLCFDYNTQFIFMPA